MSKGQQDLDRLALERILEVTRRLATPFELTEMLGEVIEAAKAVLGADRGSVFLYDAEANELVVSVASGLDSMRFPADKGIVGQCVQNREIINVPDAYADPRFNREIDQKSGYRTRCLLTLPLIGLDASLVGALQLLNKQGGVFTEADERIASTLAAQCAVALQRVKMTEQLLIKEKLERELAVAREIQQGVLPREMPSLAGYDVAGLSVPADETGGDTFDFVAVAGHQLMVLLGDATGHGVGPAISVTQVRAMLRMAQRLGAGLDDTFVNINDQLTEDLADNRFVTAFLGLLDAKLHRVAYHAGGQGPLLHFRAAGGECVWHKASSLPLGLMAGIPLPKAQSIEFAPGDILGLITDGVFEYENTAAEAFGEEGVARFLREHHEEPMEPVCKALLQKVREFGLAVPQADDITIVLIRRLP